MMPVLRKAFNTSPRQVIDRLRMWMEGRKRLTEFNADTPVFFFLSTGRAGTMTLTELLNLAPEAKVYHEPQPYLFPLSKLAYFLDESYYPLLTDILQACRKDLLNASLASGVGYGETGNHCTFLAPMLAGMFPYGKFVHLIRDPRYVIRSGMRRKWYEGHPCDPWRIEPRPGTKESALWQAWTTFDKCAWFWAETNRQIFQFCDTLEPHRYRVIRSEAIFHQDKNVISDLFRFLGLTEPGQADMTRVLDQCLNQQEGGRFLHPKDWSKEMESRMHHIICEEMAGYTKNEVVLGMINERR